MGCRCCKVIQSYIFDPHEVQTSGYISEINNYKSDSLDGGKFKSKRNVEIQVHKNELQNAESQPSANRNKINNSKDALRNHRNMASHEEGFSNHLDKSNVNINGVLSCSNLNSSHNTNQNKEASRQVSSAQLPNCSAKGLSHPEDCVDANLEADPPKLPSMATESSQDQQLPATGENGSLASSATLEAQSFYSADSDFSENASQQTVAGHENLSNNHTHSTQSPECIILNKHVDQALGESQRGESGDQGYRTDTLNGYLSDISSLRPNPEALVEAEEVCCGEVKGEFEEEDADIAEALAALDAATAEEDFEDAEEEH